MVDVCKNCKTEVTLLYCPNCGNPVKLTRINRQYIVKEFGSVLNLDKGIFYTVKELFIRPGDVVREFIFEDRKKLVKPIIFLIISSFFYTIMQQLLGFEAGYIDLDFEDGNTPFIVKIYSWFSKNYGYANILIGILVTLWIKIFFKKYNYNYYEIYILLCFTMGFSILISTLFGIIESIIKYPVLQFGAIISSIYISWAIGQFFDRKKKLNYLKAYLSYIFGIITSLIIFFAIGIGLDILLK